MLCNATYKSLFILSKFAKLTGKTYLVGFFVLVFLYYQMSATCHIYLLMIILLIFLRPGMLALPTVPGKVPSSAVRTDVGRYEPKKLSWENTNNKCMYHKYLKGQRLIYTQHIFLMRRCTSHVLKRVIYWMRGTSKDLQKEKRDNQTNFINKVSVKFLSFWMFGGRNWGKCRNNNLILKQFDHLVFIVCVK